MEFTRNEKRAIVQLIGTASDKGKMNSIVPLLIKTLSINSSAEMEELWDVRVSQSELLTILSFNNSLEKRKIFERLMDAIK